MTEQQPYQFLGHLDGAKIGVQHTDSGQDILIQHKDLGQRLACLLGIAKAEIVRREDGFYYRIPHDRQVDDLLVELIDVLISIRYAHPAMVQLEMVLEPAEP
jgi:hypothetical protein